MPSVPVSDFELRRVFFVVCIVGYRVVSFLSLFYFFLFLRLQLHSYLHQYTTQLTKHQCYLSFDLQLKTLLLFKLTLHQYL